MCVTCRICNKESQGWGRRRKTWRRPFMATFHTKRHSGRLQRTAMTMEETPEPPTAFMGMDHVGQHSPMVWNMGNTTHRTPRSFEASCSDNTKFRMGVKEWPNSDATCYGMTGRMWKAEQLENINIIHECAIHEPSITTFWASDCELVLRHFCLALGQFFNTLLMDYLILLWHFPTATPNEIWS